MPRFYIPPTTSRQAKWSVFAIMLLGPVYLLALPYLITITGAWRAWRYKPALFWKPFTLLSYLLAVSAVLLWPRFVGDYYAQLGFSQPAAAGSGSFLEVVAWWTTSFIAWSLALLPHTLARSIHALTAKREAS